MENGPVSRCKPYFSLSARDEDSSITVIELSFYKGKNDSSRPDTAMLQRLLGHSVS